MVWIKRDFKAHPVPNLSPSTIPGSPKPIQGSRSAGFLFQLFFSLRRSLPVCEGFGSFGHGQPRAVAAQFLLGMWVAKKSKDFYGRKMGFFTWEFSAFFPSQGDREWNNYQRHLHWDSWLFPTIFWDICAPFLLSRWWKTNWKTHESLMEQKVDFYPGFLTLSTFPVLQLHPLPPHEGKMKLFRIFILKSRHWMRWEKEQPPPAAAEATPKFKFHFLCPPTAALWALGRSQRCNSCFLSV